MSNQRRLSPRSRLDCDYVALASPAEGAGQGTAGQCGITLHVPQLIDSRKLSDDARRRADASGVSSRALNLADGRNSCGAVWGTLGRWNLIERGCLFPCLTSGEDRSSERPGIKQPSGAAASSVRQNLGRRRSQCIGKAWDPLTQVSRSRDKPCGHNVIRMSLQASLPKI